MAHRRSARFARDDKKERAVKRRGPLPWARAVATSIQPLLHEIKKVTTYRDDKEIGNGSIKSSC
jgi:hypothetical protein